VLDIAWCQKPKIERAEPRIADAIDERFPEDFVYQL
jgi:hypothetical protein